MVRSEWYKSAKGVITVTLCPTLALYMTKHGLSHAYCGFRGWQYELAQFIFVFFAVDFFEWGWHWLGHYYDVLWEIHRPHVSVLGQCMHSYSLTTLQQHKYHNPTPWAVIADDAPDEFMRGSPLFILPLLMPINLEMLFLQFILFFNLYGTMIHTGIDWWWLPIHGQKIINTPYHHHIHHALSTKNKPLHTGFFLQIWDRMTGSVYKGEKCYCAACDVKAGNRTPGKWEETKKQLPDYSVLLQPSFWLNWTDDGKTE